MKKLLLTLALLSFANSAMASSNHQKIVSLGEGINRVTIQIYCIEGVEYFSNYKPKLLPSGKSATCNY